MEVGETLGEFFRSAESSNQRRHVLWHEEGIHPGTPFVGFVAVGIEVARREVVQRRTKGWVLKAECAVQISGLEESDKSTVDGAVGEVCSVGYK